VLCCFVVEQVEDLHLGMTEALSNVKWFAARN